MSSASTVVGDNLPGCLRCGWRPYFVETVEGKVEWAWELCPRCEGGDAFPPEGDE